MHMSTNQCLQRHIRREKVARLFPGLELHVEILEGTTYLADSDDERDITMPDRLIVLEPSWRSTDI